MQDILKQVRMHRIIEIEVTDNPRRAAGILEGKFAIASTEFIENLVRVEFTGSDEEIPRMLKLLVDSGMTVVWFRESAADLEEIFMTVTKLAAGERERAARDRTQGTPP